MFACLCEVVPIYQQLIGLVKPQVAIEPGANWKNSSYFNRTWRVKIANISNHKIHT